MKTYPLPLAHLSYKNSRDKLYIGLKYKCIDTIIVVIKYKGDKIAMTFIEEAVIGEFISEVVNNCVDVSWGKIKEADKNRKSKSQNIQTRIYQVIIDAINIFTCNKYKNQNKLYDAAETLLNGFKNSVDNQIESVKIGLNILISDVDNDTCERFIETLRCEVGKEANFDLYKEILLILLERATEYKSEELYEIKLQLEQINKKLDEKNEENIYSFLRTNFDEINSNNQNVSDTPRINLKQNQRISVQKNVKNSLTNKKPSLFISYSRNDREFVDELDNKLQKHGYNVEIDTRDLKPTQSINEFRKRIRITDYSIIVLSDSFLKSENCMREIFQFIRDENYKDRIIPIILESAKEIWGENKGIKYTIYWKDRKRNLEEQLKLIDEESKGGYIEELKHITSIKNSIGEVIGIFRDMKMFEGECGTLVDDLNKYIKKKDIRNF